MRWILLVLPALLTGAAIAAPQEKPPEPLDLVHQVERLAAGKPLPVVVAADRYTGRPQPSVPDDPDGLLATLQDLGAAYSSRPVPDTAEGVFRDRMEKYRTVYQPFAFDTPRGRLWTIASDRVWTPSAQPLDVLSDFERYRSIQTFFSSMTAEQLRRAGTAGLGWRDLTPAQQATFADVLARPWAVTQSADGPDGIRTTRFLRTSAEPLPVEKCTLRLSIGFDRLAVDRPGEAPDDESGNDWYSLQPDAPSLDVLDPESPSASRIFPRAPHVLKPSDLDYGAAALDKPIGIQGVTTVGSVVAAAALSRLPLREDARWKDRAAFVGDGTMRAGDVLRAMAFAVDGAWRRVGQTYLFTWDRTGLAAQSLATRVEDAKARVATTYAMKGKIEATPSEWVRLALRTLPAGPGVPVKPNAAQTDALLASLPADTPEDEAYRKMYERLSDAFQWSRLDADQQTALRAAAASGGIRTRAKQPAFDPDLLPTSTLDGLSLYATLTIPGVGAVDASSALATLFAQPDGTDQVMDAYRKAKAAETHKADAAALANPVALSQPVRAVAPPPLLPGEWPRLLDQMRRKGLNMLYLPVLWDGMTLCPSDHFPMLPLCDGRDVLADVLRQAKARGVRVVAVLHTLAWRMPESKVHWLTQHPELVDVDAAGQSRWNWRAGINDDRVLAALASDADGLRRKDAAAYADYVRPDAPQVRTRLLGLIGELRRYKGLSGVALADWTRVIGTNPGDSEYGWGEVAPPLGDTLPSRIAFLDKNGVDPLDIEPLAFYIRRNRDLEAGEYQAKWAAFRVGEDAALAKTLLAAIAKDRPGGAQLFTFFQAGPDIPVPAADVVITPDATPIRGRAANYRHVTLASSAPDDEETGATPAADAPDANRRRLDEFALALRRAAPSARSSGIFKADGIVLDFTAAPDLMWDGLKLLPDTKR